MMAIEKELPEGWVTTKIKDAFELKTGGTPRRNNLDYFDGNIKWLVSGDINKGQIYDCKGRITEKGFNNSNTKLLPESTVLIALNGQGKTRATVAMLRTEATCNQSLVGMITKDPHIFYPEFLFYYLKSQYTAIRNLTGLNERRGLNMKIVGNLTIPVPPLEEQKRIVAKLDAVFEKIDKNIEVIDSILSRCYDLFDSELYHIFSDGLEDGPFISESIMNHRQGYYKPGKLDKGSTCFARISDINSDNKFDFESMPQIQVNNISKDRFSVNKGDFLFARTGGAGNFALCDKQLDCIFASYLIRFRFNKTYLPEFLYFYFKSTLFQNNLKSRIHGGVNQNIHAEDIKLQKVPLKSLDDQKNIVQSLTGAQSGLKLIENRLKAKSDDLNTLKSSIFDAAFRGKL